jgi:hypothetical protein
MKKTEDTENDEGRAKRLQAARQAWSEKQVTTDKQGGTMINSVQDTVDRAGYVRTGYNVTFNDLRKEEIEALLAAVYARVEAEDDLCEEELNKRSGSRLSTGSKAVGGDGKIKL